MNFYVLKVEQYYDGEGYEGYWLILSATFDGALAQLHENKKFKELESWTGVTVTQSSLEEAQEHFGSSVDTIFEMVGDNYN